MTEPIDIAVVVDTVDARNLVHDHVARMAGPLIAQAVRSVYPTARWLLIEATDQDSSGALWACSVQDDDDVVLGQDFEHIELASPDGYDFGWLMLCLDDGNRDMVWGLAEDPHDSSRLDLDRLAVIWPRL